MALGRTNINLPEIVIPSKSLLLYNYGDECTENSGGWTWQKHRGSLSTLTNTKNEDHLYSYGKSNTAAYYANFGWSTQNKVDVTGYTKLKALMCGTNSYDATASQFSIMLRNELVQASYRNSSDSNTPTSIAGYFHKVSCTSPIEVEVDITDIDGEYYVQAETYAIVSGQTGVLKVYKVWLE